MRMLRLLPLVLFSFAAAASHSAAAAQSGPAAVQIITREEGTGVPIPGAHVMVNGVGSVAVSDSMGRAHGLVVRTGVRLVQVRRVGYLPESFTVEFRPGEAVAAEVEMQRAPLELEGLTVTGLMPSRSLRDAGFYGRRKQGFGRFVDAEEIYRRKDSNLSSLMRSIPGVNVVYCPRPKCEDEGYVLLATASNVSINQACRMAIYLDGMPVKNEDIDRMSVRALEGVEAYPRSAGVPPQFGGTGSACGVILLWTRSS
jgi:hypothetical protein